MNTKVRKLKTGNYILIGEVSEQAYNKNINFVRSQCILITPLKM